MDFIITLFIGSARFVGWTFLIGSIVGLIASIWVVKLQPFRRALWIVFAISLAAFFFALLASIFMNFGTGSQNEYTEQSIIGGSALENGAPVDPAEGEANYNGTSEGDPAQEESVPAEPTNGTCKPATLVTDPKIDDIVLADLSDGDPKHWTLTVVDPASNTPGKNTILALTPAGRSLDIVFEKMVFSSYRLSGSYAEVACFIIGEFKLGEVGYIIYNDEALPDEGTSWILLKDAASAGGWWDSMTSWVYTETHINSGEAPEFYIDAFQKDRNITPTSGLSHGQFWYAGLEGVVVHPVVEAGYTFTVADSYQGSGWKYFTVNGTTIDTILQASRFVVDRDDVKVVVMPYCGANVPAKGLEATYVDTNDVTHSVQASWIGPDQPLSYIDPETQETVTLQGFTCVKN